MALSDPQSVTINTVANPLPRISVDRNASTYSKDTGDLKLAISSSYGKRTRRAVRMDFRKTAADPMFPAQNAPYSMSCTLVVDVPVTGYSVTEQKQIVDGLLAWATASSGANLTKILGGES